MSCGVSKVRWIKYDMLHGVNRDIYGQERTLYGVNKDLSVTRIDVIWCESGFVCYKNARYMGQ